MAVQAGPVQSGERSEVAIGRADEVHNVRDILSCYLIVDEIDDNVLAFDCCSRTVDSVH